MKAFTGWLIVLLLLAGGCATVGSAGERRGEALGAEGSAGQDVVTESRTVELQGAESVEATVTMLAGQLTTSGGAEHLLDAEFTYDVPEWRPIVEYTVDGTAGNLVVRQPETDRDVTRENNRYEWDLRFNNDVPIDLHVRQGAGQATLDLRGMNLGTFDLDSGAGQVLVDLSGNWRRDVTATVHTGAGQLTLRLPETVGTRVELDTGVGIINAQDLRRDGDAYVNDAYGTTDVTMNIAVDAGVGVIDLEVAE